MSLECWQEPRLTARWAISCARTWSVNVTKVENHDVKRSTRRSSRSSDKGHSMSHSVLVKSQLGLGQSIGYTENQFAIYSSIREKCGAVVDHSDYSAWLFKFTRILKKKLAQFQNEFVTNQDLSLRVAEAFQWPPKWLVICPSSQLSRMSSKVEKFSGKYTKLIQNILLSSSLQKCLAHLYLCWRKTPNIWSKKSENTRL